MLILPMLLEAFQHRSPHRAGPLGAFPSAEKQEEKMITVHEDIPVTIKRVPQQIRFSGFGAEKLRAAWVG
jgi:hypothetical protein